MLSACYLALAIKQGFEIFADRLSFTKGFEFLIHVLIAGIYFFK